MKVSTFSKEFTWYQSHGSIPVFFCPTLAAIKLRLDHYRRPSSCDRLCTPPIYFFCPTFPSSFAMAGDKPESSSNSKVIHPVYTVTNIQNKVRVLDGVKVSYSSWVRLFQLHAKGYKVTAHIDGTTPPAKTDPSYEEWAEIDAIVLQWIYGTLSDDLLMRVLVTDSTAYQAWLRIQTIFLNNKGARAAALEHEFNNLTLKSMPSLESYFQKLKELSDQLNDVDNPVNEQRLVLQLVRGLPSEYDTVASYINQTLPSWESACSMLQLEHHRQSARETLSPPAALAVSSPPNPTGGNRRFNGRGQTRQPNRRPNSSSLSSGSHHTTGPPRGSSNKPASSHSRGPFRSQAQWPTSPGP